MIFKFGAGLPPHQAEAVAAHLDMTRHLRYGGLERAQAAIFRLPYDHPDVIHDAPEAALLRGLAAAIRQGAGQVRASGMARAQRYRVSELLHQSADRALRGDHGDAPVARYLSGLATGWDKTAGVRSEEGRRARMTGRRA